MREEKQLLEAIASGDDTARLAYADLLEERGDERAGWVRDLTVWRWMAPDAHDPVGGLIEALGEESPARHQSAQAALARVGAPAAAPLLEMLKVGGDILSPAWRAGNALAEMPRAAVEPVLPELFALAANEDDHIRGPAIEALRAVGEAAAPALQALIEALGEVSEYRHTIVEAVAAVLKNIGPPAIRAVPDLLAQGCYEYEIRDAIESTIAAIGPAAAPIILEEAAHIEEDHRRLWCAEPLRRLGSAIVPLLREAVERPIGDDDLEVILTREVAALALAEHDPESALPVLLDGLEASGGDYSRESDRPFAEALRAMGPVATWGAERMRRILPSLSWSGAEAITEALAKLGQAEEATAELVGQFQSGKAQPRTALAALFHQNEVPEQVLPTVLSFLTDEDLRHMAMDLLARLAEGPQRSRVWPSILALAAHPAEPVAVWACEVLGKQVPEADAQAALRGCLRDSRPAVRAAALKALAGPGLGDLEAEFLRLAADRNPTVRVAAAHRLGDTGPMTEAVAVAIRRLLSSRIESVRIAAVRAAGLRGPRAVGASAVLVRLARNDPSIDVREPAIDLVPECGLPPAEAVALLRRCLAEDPEERPRRAAAFAIGAVALLPGGRQAAAAALPDLLARLGQDHWDHAEITLARIGPAAVPGLIEVLRKGNDEARAAACAALAALGETARPAAAALVEALACSDHATREQAAWALAAVGAIPAGAVPGLRRMLWAETEGQVAAAIAALVAAQATASFNDLARIAQRQDTDLSATALWGAARLGERSRVVALLQGALTSTLANVRAVAAVELARLDAGAPPSIDDLFAACIVAGLRPRLLEELTRRSSDPAVLATAARVSREGGHAIHSFGMEVLARLGGQNPEATVNALVSAFMCHDQIVLPGLGDHGAGSRIAFDAIQRRMGSYDPANRAAAVAAMRKLLSAAPAVGG
jgi:uncharacterized protein (TIGR02996 family)